MIFPRAAEHRAGASVAGVWLTRPSAAPPVRTPPAKLFPIPNFSIYIQNPISLGSTIEEPPVLFSLLLPFLSPATRFLTRCPLVRFSHIYGCNLSCHPLNHLTFHHVFPHL